MYFVGFPETELGRGQIVRTWFFPSGAHFQPSRMQTCATWDAIGWKPFAVSEVPLLDFPKLFIFSVADPTYYYPHTTRTGSPSSAFKAERCWANIKFLIIIIYRSFEVVSRNNQKPRVKHTVLNFYKFLSLPDILSFRQWVFPAVLWALHVDCLGVLRYRFSNDFIFLILSSRILSRKLHRLSLVST